MGRKIDLLFLESTVNDKNLKEYIELCSREIKPADVSSVVEVIQLNKSIRVSKSILHNVITHMGEEDSHNLYIFSLDIIGKVIILSLSGYAYSIRQHEDIVTAVKLVDDNMFLPVDHDDLEDFMNSNTLD